MLGLVSRQMLDATLEEAAIEVGADAVHENVAVGEVGGFAVEAGIAEEDLGVAHGIVSVAAVNGRSGVADIEVFEFAAEGKGESAIGVSACGRAISDGVANSIVVIGGECSRAVRAG